MENEQNVTEHFVGLMVVKFSRICFHGKMVERERERERERESVTQFLSVCKKRDTMRSWLSLVTNSMDQFSWHNPSAKPKV
jgi:hypothetical protein